MQNFLSIILVFYSVLSISQKIHTPFEQGEVKNNTRIGVWKYYDEHAKPGLIIDYNSNTIIHIESDSTDFYIKRENSWEKTKLSNPPRPHYSKLELTQYLQAGVNIFSDFINKKQSMQAFLTFEVSEKGEATNPVIISSAKTEAERVFIDEGLKKLFKTIPNFWIPGALRDGNPVTTRLAVFYQVCNQTCEPPDYDKAGASALYKFDMLFGSPAPVISGKSKHVLELQENYGIQYSPDDSKLMISVGNFNYANIYKPIKPNFLSIIDLSSQKQTRVSFGDIIGGSWIQNNNFLFIYNQDFLVKEEACIFNTTNQEIDPIPVASTKDFNLQSSHVLLQYRSAGDTIYLDVLHPKTDKKISMGSTFSKMLSPLGWSSDQKYLLAEQPSGDISKIQLINALNGEATFIPLLNSIVCGWSKDGQDLYLLKSVLGYNTPVHDLYRYNVDSKELQEIRVKWKEIDRIKYTNQTNSFLVLRNGRLEIWDQQHGETTSLVDRDVLEAAWSNSGKSIAYIKKGKKSILEYNLETGKIKLIATWSTKKKELIIE